MTPPRRMPELSETKRLLVRSRDSSGVRSNEIAYVLGVSEQYITELMNGDHRHMKIADLLCLSKHPAMREFVQQVLAGIQSNVDSHLLRVCDLDQMSKTHPESARAALRTVAGRLWPQIGPVDSQTPETVENGADTRTTADDLPVRRARTNGTATEPRPSR